MSHIVLLGDSIFDNAVYVQNDLPVIAQLREKLPADWQATLCAVDGDCVEDIPQQLKKLPKDATHLFISAGGNNALGQSSILTERVDSSTEVFLRLASLSEEFGKSYHQVLQRVLQLGLPTTVCTIYYPNFADAMYNRVAIAALTIFNDVILREAFQAGIPVIDLRLIFNETKDYANPIEPSAIGGNKMTDVIMKVALKHDFNQTRTQIYAS